MFIWSNSCLKLEGNFKSIYYKSVSQYVWKFFLKVTCASKGEGYFIYPFCVKTFVHFVWAFIYMWQCS